MTVFRRIASFLSKPSVRAALVLGLAFALFVGSGSKGATLTGDPIRYVLAEQRDVDRHRRLRSSHADHDEGADYSPR